MPSQLVMISWNDGDTPFPVGPDNSLPNGGMNRPDNSLPSQGSPIQLPVYPFDPTLSPDNSLPTPPTTVWPPRPGMSFKVKWLACKGLILVPDNSLPPTPEPK